MISRHASRPSPSASLPPGHALETERRLTTLEIVSEDHGQKIDRHSGKHEAQDVWNKGFSVALLGLASGLAHAKAGDLIDFALALFRGWRP